MPLIFLLELLRPRDLHWGSSISYREMLDLAKEGSTLPKKFAVLKGDLMEGPIRKNP